MEQQDCYCDPTILSVGCNINGCMTIAGIFLLLFVAPFIVCIYRFYIILQRAHDNLWSIISHSLITFTCVCRIIRSALLLKKVENSLAMGFLYLFPIVVLICCYFNTLYVWIKIIYHVNFSRYVEKVFPFLAKTMIAFQMLLLLSILVCILLSWPYYVTNIILFIFLSIGAVGFAVFGKMIWAEYKVVSNKDCGVFSETTHSKIQKVTKLSGAAIIVAFFTFGLVLWGWIVPYPLQIDSIIAFSFIGRIVESLWIASMLLVLSPSLQTWGAGASKQVSAATANHFDDLSDSSIDIENEEVGADKTHPSSSLAMTELSTTPTKAGTSDV